MRDSEILRILAAFSCICGASKAERKSHCPKCYKSLPPEKQKALYRRFGNGYSEAYIDSLIYLDIHPVEEVILITDEVLLSGKSTRGGWTRDQLTLMGVNWPPAKNWKDQVIGRQLPKSVIDRFIGLNESRSKQLGEAAL